MSNAKTKAGSRKKRSKLSTKSTQSGKLKLSRLAKFNRTHLIVGILLIVAAGIFVVVRARAAVSIAVFPLDTTQYDIYTQGTPNNGQWCYKSSTSCHGTTYSAADIFADEGTVVRSATDGTVSGNPINQPCSSSSNNASNVWVKDAKGYYHFYQHMSNGSVAPKDQDSSKPGIQVKAGDYLGKVGNSTCAFGTQPHLHYFVSYGGMLGCSRTGGCSGSGTYKDPQPGLIAAFRKLPFAGSDFWEQVKQPPGNVEDVGAGGAGVWVISSDQMYKWTGSDWDQAAAIGGSGGGKVDVSSSKPWMMSDAGNIYTYSSGKYTSVMSTNTAKDIGVGPVAWAAYADGQEWYYANGWINPSGGGSAARLDVAPSGNVYKITTSGNIYSRSNSSGAWTQLSGSLAGGDISIGGDSSIWGIEAGKTVVRIKSAWRTAGGGGSDIAVDKDGRPWKVKSGVIYRGKMKVF